MDRRARNRPAIGRLAALAALALAPVVRGEDLGRAWQIALTVNARQQARQLQSSAARAEVDAAEGARLGSVRNFTINCAGDPATKLRPAERAEHGQHQQRRHGCPGARRFDRPARRRAERRAADDDLVDGAGLHRRPAPPADRRHGRRRRRHPGRGVPLGARPEADRRRGIHRYPPRREDPPGRREQRRTAPLLRRRRDEPARPGAGDPRGRALGPGRPVEGPTGPHPGRRAVDRGPRRVQPLPPPPAVGAGRPRRAGGRAAPPAPRRGRPDGRPAAGRGRGRDRGPRAAGPGEPPRAGRPGGAGPLARRPGRRPAGRAEAATDRDGRPRLPRAQLAEQHQLPRLGRDPRLDARRLRRHPATGRRPASSGASPPPASVPTPPPT